MPLDIDALASRFDGYADQVKTALENSVKSQEETQARLTELEQMVVRGGRGGGGNVSHTKSAGQIVAESAELADFKTRAHSRPTRARIELKTTLTTASNSAGSLTDVYRDDTLILPRKPLTIRNLIPSIQISENSVEYPRMTSRTSAASVVAEVASKPESALAFDLVSTPTRVIAHWIPASRQIIDDAPQLAGLIDSELRDGLAQKEEAEILNGDGTGEHLMGLVPSATAYSAPITISSPNSIDQVGLALLQNALANYPADAIVMHPSDWMFMRLLKNADGEYLLGDPSKSVSQVLFGLPVVTSTSMTIDKFLVGNFRTAATIYDRWQARVEIATEHADFFVRNLVAILAEERLGLAVKRPLALTYGDFGRVA